MRELLAGLSVAAVEIPQAMAYALLAGVPAQHGLFASVIQSVTAAVLNGSARVVTGPTNTQSLLVASIVSRLIDPVARPEAYLQLVFTLTLLKGVFQTALGVTRLAELTRFVSRSVVVGLTAGAGVLILAHQLPVLLGVIAPAVHGRWPGVFGAIQPLLSDSVRISPPAAAVGVGSLLALLLLRVMRRPLPGPLIVVAGAACIAGMTGLAAGIPVIGPIPRALPGFVVPWPGWQLLQACVLGAAALAVLGLIETVAISRTLAGDDGRGVDAPREAVSQGVSNAISAFFQCIPGSGSFTRSMLARDAGAVTPLSPVFAAVAIVLVLLLFSPFARLIPLASIAAVLVGISVWLIDVGFITRVFRTSRSDAAVCVMTFLATVTAPLEIAVFVGIGLNLVLYVQRAARLHMNELVPAGAGRTIERPVRPHDGQAGIIFVQLEGDLFFGIADELQQRLDQLARSDARVVILRLKRSHSIDTTVLHVLEQFIRRMQAGGRHVLLCGVREETAETLRSFGIARLLGPGGIFVATSDIWGSAKLALLHARTLAQPSASGTSEASTGGMDYEI